MSEAIAAATVLPLRDGPDGIEVLMLKRSSRGAFGGLWVFPGGKVDPEDGEEELASARRAAVREAMEEASIAIEEASLVTWSHWLPPETKAPGAQGYVAARFSTWFFVAAAHESGEVVVDGGEIHEHAWLRPHDALAKRAAGEIELAPPTFTSLSQLALYATVEEVLAAGRAQAEPPRHHTRIVMLDGTRVLLWAGDSGYATGELDLPGPRNRVVWREPDLVWDRTFA